MIVLLIKDTLQDRVHPYGPFQTKEEALDWGAHHIGGGVHFYAEPLVIVVRPAPPLPLERSTLYGTNEPHIQAASKPGDT